MCVLRAAERALSASSLYGMGLIGSLWGQYSLQTASEVKTESAGEIGDPNLLYDQVSMNLY